MALKPDIPAETGPRALYLENASDAENARIGPYGTALIDYLLHPPGIGDPPVGQDISPKQLSRRGAALRALITGAFEE